MCLSHLKISTRLVMLISIGGVGLFGLVQSNHAFKTEYEDRSQSIQHGLHTPVTTLQAGYHGPTLGHTGRRHSPHRAPAARVSLRSGSTTLASSDGIAKMGDQTS
jgi:hypothetical protein